MPALDHRATPALLTALALAAGMLMLSAAEGSPTDGGVAHDAKAQVALAAQTRRLTARLRKYIQGAVTSQPSRSLSRARSRRRRGSSAVLRLGLLRRDRRLDAVAADNSRALAEVGGRVPTGALSYLRFKLHQRGIHDAVLRAAVLRLRPQGALALPQSLQRDASNGRYTHLGVGLAPLGAAGSTWLATVVLVRRAISLAPPRTRRGGLQLCGKLLSGRRPLLLLASPAGKVRRYRLPLRRRRFCRWLPLAAQGRYQVEITVQGPYGPEVTVLFSHYEGTASPLRPHQRLYPPGEKRPQRAELELLTLLNRSRRGAKLAPLSLDRRLAAVARRHSVDMAQGGFFGHRSPRHGGLSQRMAAAGLGHLAASENLALASSAQRAHDSLLESPSHRAVLMDPNLGSVGIGVVRDGNGLLYITQCFVRQRR